MDFESEINKLATEVYHNAIDKGFHDEDTQRSEVENFAIWTTNLHGEVTELWEAARSGSLFDPCDKDIGLSCEEEEMADIVIRVMDSASARGINLGRAILAKHEYNKTRPHKHGGKRC